VPVFLRAPGRGRTHLELEVLYSPDKGKRWPNGKALLGGWKSEEAEPGLTSRKRIRGGAAGHAGPRQRPQYDRVTEKKLDSWGNFGVCTRFSFGWRT
jgi:hypothetical protein